MKDEIKKTLAEDYGITGTVLRANLVVYICNLIEEEREACAEMLKAEAARQMGNREKAKTRQEEGDSSAGAAAVTFLHSADVCQRVEKAIRARSKP